MLSVFFLKEAGKKALSFVLVALLFLALAMGRNNFFYFYLHAWAPFFNKIRYPVKFLFMVFLFLSVSAGLGLDALKRGLYDRQAFTKRAITVMLALSTVAAAAFGLLNFFDPEVKRFLVDRGMDYPMYNHVDINVFNAKRGARIFMVFSTLLSFYMIRSGLFFRLRR